MNFSQNKNKRRGAKIQSKFMIILSKTPENLSLVKPVSNYHKLLLLPLVVKFPWWKFWKTKISVKFLTFLLLLEIGYIFKTFKALNVLQSKHREPNFRHNFYPFSSLGMHGLVNSCSVLNCLFFMLIFLWLTLMIVVYVSNLGFYYEVVSPSWFPCRASSRLANFCY